MNTGAWIETVRDAFVHDLISLSELERSLDEILAGNEPSRFPGPPPFQPNYALIGWERR